MDEEESGFGFRGFRSASGFWDVEVEGRVVIWEGEGDGDEVGEEEGEGEVEVFEGDEGEAAEAEEGEEGKQGEEEEAEEVLEGEGPGGGLGGGYGVHEGRDRVGIWVRSRKRGGSAGGFASLWEGDFIGKIPRHMLPSNRRGARRGDVGTPSTFSLNVPPIGGGHVS